MKMNPIIKKITVLSLTAVIGAGVLPVQALPGGPLTAWAATALVDTGKVLEKGQWVDDGAGRKYVYADGTFAQNTWKGIDGFYYHFDANGYMERSRPVCTKLTEAYSLNEAGQLYRIAGGGTVISLCTYRNDQSVPDGDFNYPLKGMLAQYGLAYAGVVEEADPIYGFSVKEVNPSYFDLKYHGSNTGVIMEYAYALSGNPANYYKIDQNMKTSRIPYGSLDPNKTEADYPEVQQVLNEIRSFLNSFDFKNASDLEKAQKAAGYVSRASYDYGTYESIQDGNAAYEDNWQTASIYGCLVNKKCVCAGCSDAFRTLVRMMGLPCITESTRDHQWDYVRIDGQWWMHSNGNLYRPGETERLANGYTVPSFENSPTNRCFGEGNPNYYMNWAYQP